MELYYATKMMEAHRVNLNIPTSSQSRPNVKVTTVENFDPTDIKPISRSKYRVGIIPYSWYDSPKDNLFALGVDGISGDLTDFGGKLESNEGFLDGAFREFHEETLGTLLPRQDVDVATEWLPLMFPDNLIYYDNVSLTLMYRLPDNFEFYLSVKMFNKLFNQTMSKFNSPQYEQFHQAIPADIKAIMKQYHDSKGERVDLYKKLWDFYNVTSNYLPERIRGMSYTSLRRQIWDSPFENTNIKLLPGKQFINHLNGITPQKLYDKVRNLIAPVYDVNEFQYNPQPIVSLPPPPGFPLPQYQKSSNM